MGAGWLGSNYFLVLTFNSNPYVIRYCSACMFAQKTRRADSNHNSPLIPLLQLVHDATLAYHVFTLLFDHM